MTQKILLSGFGGQGILSAGIMISEAAIKQGHKVTFYPAYGAEMRGGTANCHVIISDDEISSPIIITADILVAMNQPSLAKFLSKTKADGTVIINTSVVKENTDFGKRKVVSIPVEQLALEKIGNPKVANVILIGALAKSTGLFNIEDLKYSIEDKFKRKGDEIVKLNWKALEIGYTSV